MTVDERALARDAYELALETVRVRGMVAVRGPGGADDPLDRELAALEAAHAARPSPRMGSLAARLGLEPDQVELLWFAVAWARDPLLAPHLHVLVAEPHRGATLVAFARVTGWPAARMRRLAAHLGSGHPLFAARLLRAGPGPIGTLTPLAVPERVCAFLAGSDGIDAAIASVGGTVALPATLVLPPALDHTIDRIALAMTEARPVVIVVSGATGVGRRTAVAEAAGRIGVSVIAVDLARVGSLAQLEDVLDALARERLLRGAVPMVVGAEAMGGDGEAGPLRGVVDRFVSAATGPVVVATRGAVPDLDAADAILRVAIAMPEPASRLALWRRAVADEAAGVGDEVLGEIALRFRLTPGAIHRAWRATRMVMAVRGHHAPQPMDLVEGIRLSTQERLGALATPVSVRAEWSDLVLPDETRDEVDAVVARARHAYQVLSEWGFARHVAGDGIAVLFSGPPGTGKTMVAGLIARELGLDLYRVDLSQVVSKWIGETEKSLGRVFDAAESGHVLLLFDEADSLFARRTEVKGATERYANLEVNYLLQRIESFSGIAILTTNLDGSIDDAFRRRLAAHVRFLAPGDDERERLWRTLLPSQAPLAADVDVRALALRYADFCGGHIRNAALGAAFLAASDGGAIAQHHLDRAARDVARAMGRVLAGPRR